MLLSLSIFMAALITLYLYTHQRHYKGRDRRRRKHNKLTQEASHNTEYHCVETHYHAHCCEAVKALHGKRFLSAEAPALPIIGCDKSDCHCDYIHHNDRRIEIRRDDVGIQHDLYGQNGEVEHRDKVRHGRRKSD